MGTRAHETEFDLAIVGAGAAGQIAAIAAAERGQRVILLEQMPKAGLKLLATGGGRANLTKMLDQKSFEAAFGRQGRFIGPAFQHLHPAALRAFFAKLGVETVADETGRVYPATHKAATVQDALTRRIESLGIATHLSSRVRQLWIDQGELRGLETDTQRFHAKRVLLACGGRSWAPLGGTGGGYRLARQAGHSLAEPLPALVPLVTQQRWVVNVAGVSLQQARLWIPLPKQPKAGITGYVLFTHRGLSGPAVLDLSGDVAQLLGQSPTVPIRMELVAGKTAAHWQQTLETWRTAAGKKQVGKLLRDSIPASLARELCTQAGLPETITAAQLPNAGRSKLAALLGQLEFTITNTEGFETAFVTRGGIKLKEVNPNTLQSRLLPNLYLAGELLNLDAQTGGLNLQWALASGHLAGMGE